VTTREIFEAALALPEDERARLVEELEATLSVEGDDELVAMISERVAAAEAGAPGTPAEQVFAELLGE
jgi:hypothetical protein